MLQMFQTTPPTRAPIRTRFELTAMRPLHGNPPPIDPGEATVPCSAGTRERDKEREADCGGRLAGVSNGARRPSAIEPAPRRIGADRAAATRLQEPAQPGQVRRD